MKLYDYYRSSASYRIRIALNLKNVAHETVQIHLLRQEQLAPAYRAVNPQARVPVLECDGEVLIQSPAILEWLEEVYPLPALLPEDRVARARVRGMAALIGCDIHPLNNSGVMTYLREIFKQDEAACAGWYSHWIELGFAALEQMVEGPFCAGEAVSMADLYLVPQMANARRMDVDVSAFPKLVGIDGRCLALEAFAAARPEVQVGAG